MLLLLHRAAEFFLVAVFSVFVADGGDVHAVCDIFLVQAVAVFVRCVVAVGFLRSFGGRGGRDGQAGGRMLFEKWRGTAGGMAGRAYPLS